MKISKPHQNFADLLNSQRALSHPDEFLGPNWKEVLNFWIYLDTLSLEQFLIASERILNLGAVVQKSAADLARSAALKTITDFNISKAFSAARNHSGGVFGYATCELIGSHKLLENGHSLVFTDLIISPE
jgi:hypothetical protein